MDYPSWTGLKSTEVELEKQTKAVEKDPEGFDSSISNAIDLKALRQSSNIVER